MPDEKRGRNAFEPSHDKERSPCNKHVNYFPSNNNAELPPGSEFTLPPSSASIVSPRVLSLYDPENPTLHPNEVWCALLLYLGIFLRMTFTRMPQNVDYDFTGGLQIFSMAMVFSPILMVIARRYGIHNPMLTSLSRPQDSSQLHLQHSFGTSAILIFLHITSLEAAPIISNSMST